MNGQGSHDPLPMLRERPIHAELHKHTDRISNDAPLWHEALEVKLFYSAGTTLVIGDKVYLSQPGDVYCINSCVPHSTRDENPANDYHMINLELSRLPLSPGSREEQLIEAICAGDITFLPLIRGDEVIVRRVEALAEACEREDGTELGLTGEIFLLLDALLRRASCSAEGHLPKKSMVELSRKLSPALSLIHREYMRRLSIEELSDACGLNPRYFCRLFRQRTGTTAVQYINRLRSANAGLLLRATDMDIGDIAEKCGFADEDYFFRVVRAYQGCTPLQYRKGFTDTVDGRNI